MLISLNSSITIKSEADDNVTAIMFEEYKSHNKIKNVFEASSSRFTTFYFTAENREVVKNLVEDIGDDNVISSLYDEGELDVIENIESYPMTIIIWKEIQYEQGYS